MSEVPSQELFIHDFPPVPRMTPILRNRHEKVQEASINLIGRIGKYLIFYYDGSH